MFACPFSMSSSGMIGPSSSWLASSEAKKITVRKDENERGQTVTIEYKEIGELPVDGIVTIRCPANEALTYWNLELKNQTKSWIGHVQFPVIEVPFDNPMEGDPSHIPVAVVGWVSGGSD